VFDFQEGRQYRTRRGGAFDWNDVDEQATDRLVPSADSPPFTAGTPPAVNGGLYEVKCGRWLAEQELSWAATESSLTPKNAWKKAIGVFRDELRGPADPAAAATGRARCRQF